MKTLIQTGSSGRVPVPLEKRFLINNFRFPVSVAGAAALLALFASGCLSRPPASGLRIDNPYDSVDWARHGRYRANFHTHTTGSDGSMNPHEAIDRYQALGYRILALTDHNAVTYPWTGLTALPVSALASNRLAEGKLETDTLARENRDPVALGMLAIEGNELSSHHHMGSFFNDHNGTVTETDSLDALAAKNGLAMLYHPGRYTKPVDWYTDLYRRYPHLVGLEVFNQGDRYPGDRAAWDAILTGLMPDRPVWGYSNDDMHRAAQLGRNYSVMLLPELTEDAVRRGLRHGWSYFVYSPKIEDRFAEPVIGAITVDPATGRIHIQARGPCETVWISEGVELHRGQSLDLTQQTHVGGYVRAELRGGNGVVVGTQPFGIRRPARILLRFDADPGAVVYADESHIRCAAIIENVSDRTLRGEIHLRVDDVALHRERVRIHPGQTVEIPAAVPVSALPGLPTLYADWDLGPAYGTMRRLSARLPLKVELPVAVDIDAPSLSAARIRLRNLMPDRDLSVECVARVDGQEALRRPVTLAGGGSAAVRCPLPPDSDGRTVRIDVETRWAPDVSPLPASFSAKIDHRDIARMARRSAPDGESGKSAGGIPAHTLRALDDVQPANRRDRWQGPEDASVELDWGWDGEAIWVHAVVADDRHSNPRSGADIWDGDMLQVSLAPVDGAPVDVGLALTSGGIVFHQWRGPALALSETAGTGVVRDEESKTTRYRLRLPLANLGIPAEPGARFGLNVVVFDDDQGGGYDVWLQMSPGLAGGWDPGRFRPFALGE